MERSIETARRRRLHESEVPARTRPLPVEQQRNGEGETLPRRKARPKRAAALRPYDGREYRVEAV